MHIAMLAPIAWRVPPRAYGPWEQVVSVLTEGLVARGADVTLFATADSRTRARLVGTCPEPLAEASHLDPKVWECLHIAALFERAAEFDLIHNHLDFLPLSYSRLVPTPMLTTIHGFSSARILPAYQAYNGHVAYVSISNADRHPDLDYTATVYHGVDLTQFTPRAAPDDYLLFLGRIHPDKGVVEAIEVARRVGRRLILAGLIHDESYYREQVEPLLDGSQISYIGVVAPKQRDDLLGGAVALLHLIAFDEPFGLSMAEAMVCGTPVIAFGRGSVPELVRHGETGFIVSSLAEAADAVGAAAGLDRVAIHRYAAERFSQAGMVEAYLQIYHQLLARRRGQVASHQRTIGAREEPR